MQEASKVSSPQMFVNLNDPFGAKISHLGLSKRWLEILWPMSQDAQMCYTHQFLLYRVVLQIACLSFQLSIEITEETSPDKSYIR